MNWKMTNLTILNKSTIRNGLSLIQNNKKRFLICVNSKEKIIGVITDGDIRRHILKDIDIDCNIEHICNKEYKKLTLNSSFSDVCELFKSDRIDFLPIVDNNILINIITKKQFHIMLLEDVSFDLTLDFAKFDNYTLEHEIYNRPWGFYKSTILSSHAQSKIITVFPKEELSLQEHKKREEHWVIIKGYGIVILGESKIDIYPGKYIFIPKGCKHQIINNSNENIIFSEVQLGSYFGEDDIIRYSDKYGRT